ncbi:hypothetical protein VC83_04471 [Pseudogymnoascus destructans]|uniref:Signal peptidase complex subunit 2 n=1 Tax=Pseudogymnoascus destructans TaxID=655981 RepID=A0A177AAS8_9PEZI|nr:uncharacterized protein VC83_04471 [Pseudogymnoascus destructans]OAF59246.1 hypothetical protein VC83_04471 [Pseudogymnoascus destructans]
MSDPNAKITVHSLSDLKNTSDDAIPNYLNSLSFTQSHTLGDVRLALGYSAFAICAACFCWDYKLGFESTKYYSAAAVTLYTLLNGALTLWVWLVEAGTVYVGTSKAGDKIAISTSTKKHTPTYTLTITSQSASAPTATTTTLSCPFTDWFDSAGHFVALPFQQMLAGAAPVIGKADPGRASAGGAGAGVAALRETVEEAVRASGSAVAGGEGARGRRKKA